MIRPIRPEDEPLIVDFHEKLSERTVYMRYFQPLKLSQRTAHERLTRICFIDYDREMALVVERKTPDGNREIISVSRMSKLHGRNEAELAAVAIDSAQHQGLGTRAIQSPCPGRTRREADQGHFQHASGEPRDAGHVYPSGIRNVLQSGRQHDPRRAGAQIDAIPCYRGWQIRRSRAIDFARFCIPGNPIPDDVKAQFPVPGARPFLPVSADVGLATGC